MHATVNPDGSADIYPGPPGTIRTSNAAPILTLPPAVVRAIQSATPCSPRPVYTPTPDASDYPDHQEGNTP